MQTIFRVCTSGIRELTKLPQYRVYGSNVCAHPLSDTLHLEIDTVCNLDDGEVAVVLQHPCGSPSTCFNALRSRAEGMVANAASCQMCSQRLRGD